jgi:hypothetical protein
MHGEGTTNQLSMIMAKKYVLHRCQGCFNRLPNALD